TSKRNEQGEEMVLSGEEAKEAELWRKSHLRELHLSASSCHESVLEGLQPPEANLQVLKIEGYWGLKFPPWMESMKLWADAWVWNITFTQRLTLLQIGVRRVNSEFYCGKREGDGGRPSSVGGAFPKLEYLRLESTFALKEWELPAMTTSETIMPSLQHLMDLPDALGELRELEHLTIMDLRSLRSMPGDGLWQQLKALKLLELGNPPNLDFIA
ncbi:hypothetical protein ACLOJK_021888, partial [Asimina triloba]